MTRRDAVLALLRSMFDYLRPCKTATYGDGTQTMPTKMAPCEKCGGTGRPGKHREGKCAACDGQKMVLVYEATGKPVTQGVDRVEPRQTRPFDPAKTTLEPWEAARIHYRQHGSYAALERALDLMRINEPGMYSLVMHEAYGELHPVPPEHLELALDWLVRHMPPQIRVPKWVIKKPRADVPGKGRHANGHAQRERDEQIRAMVAGGVTQAKTAERFGLSRSAVSRIVAAGQKPLV